LGCLLSARESDSIERVAVVLVRREEERQVAALGSAQSNRSGVKGANSLVTSVRRRSIDTVVRSVAQLHLRSEVFAGGNRTGDDVLGGHSGVGKAQDACGSDVLGQSATSSPLSDSDLERDRGRCLLWSL
jgi:hypothetical protein